MFGKNKNYRDDSRRYSRAENAGYDERFGQYGMRGPERHTDQEIEGPRSSSRLNQEYTDYASFEGASDRPYYGGEEGRFPYGGSSERSAASPNSWNADERNFSGSQNRGTHSGKGPKGYRRSDDRIREEVCDLLTDHHEIDATEIEVDVKDSVVQLSGTVESRRIKRLAEDMIERVNGVQDVQNDLRVIAHGIAPVVGRDQEFARENAAGTPSSQRSHQVRSQDRSTRKNTKSAQSSQRRMNS